MSPSGEKKRNDEHDSCQQSQTCAFHWGRTCFFFLPHTTTYDLASGTKNTETSQQDEDMATALTVLCGRRLVDRLQFQVVRPPSTADWSRKRKGTFRVTHWYDR
mmetsp:Transcript_19728/g.37390  ORF Transcript_19728/g.37390 Transcript_19728/m.37390 type:complete len:104 (+) Transcript_19728:157-468(+)